MKRTLLTGLFNLLIILGCEPDKNQNSIITKITNLDSLHFYSIDKDLISVKLTSDTLTIVTANPDTYYPLGQFNSMNELKKSYKSFDCEVEKQYPYNDNSFDTEELYNLTFKKTQIKTLFDSENKTVEIVSGEINDSEIKLNSEITIGDSKELLLIKYFSRIPENREHINVIVLESGLTGFWQYFEFDQSELNRIRFDSDYEFER